MAEVITKWNRVAAQDDPSLAESKLESVRDERFRVSAEGKQIACPLISAQFSQAEQPDSPFSGKNGLVFS